MNKIPLQNIQDKTSLENTLFFLIRTLYPQIIKQYNGNAIEYIILLYLHYMFDDYNISLDTNTKTNEKYFVFTYRSFITYDNTKNSINIPYIDILRKLYNDITTNKLQRYIKLKEKKMKLSNINTTEDTKHYAMKYII